MVLKPVQPGQKHHAGLVLLRRRAKDQRRQRHGRVQHRAETRSVALAQQRDRMGGGRGQRIEDAQKRVAEALIVALDQFGIVEIVAGMLSDVPAAGGASALLVLVQEADLDAVDLGPVAVDHLKRGVQRVLEPGRAPIAASCGSNMSPSQCSTTGWSQAASTRS